MKKIKNIMLVGGIATILLYVFCSAILSIAQLFTGLAGIGFVIHSEIIPAIITLVLLIMPTFLLIRSLKNKTGKALPIICIITKGFFLSIILFNASLSTIDFYIFYSKLGLVDTYIPHIISYWTSGAVFLIVGLALIILGSILSSFKRRTFSKEG